ncbi:MAG: bifunctional phosphopantothenoylcysteine decarboxylase/phosphopantothenate--cysteine ligase CoaBC [SAR324 cluster bacterium]|nr:bifunctional phosphopantothenoylcysteine decarboxylase/phosphopantothenate--cysteine ligase CoaBC [SAR324 cluster bacterium]
MSSLKGREILLGVSGGIACYKAVEVLRGLKKAGAEVQVVMSAHAQAFVTPLTFQTLSNRPVGTTLFELDRESRIGHIHMAERAELALVAPCTANVAAKLRAGIADDLLTTVLLATSAPTYLALAMNDHMLAHAATRENLEVLQGRGVHIIPPEVGFLAEGKEGPGRLADPESIVERVAVHFGAVPASAPGHAPPLAGKRVLVTAGPTVEAIDPVRFISNRSSGRMGFAVAEAGRAAGAQVTLVRGPVNLPDPQGMEIVPVHSAAEMRAAVMERLPSLDALVLAAAVADFRMGKTEPHKIKRAGKSSLTLKLEANPDIAAEVGEKKRPGQVLVIFAAESENLLANAEKKLKSKGADLVVANDITLHGSGFDASKNKVTLISRHPMYDGQPILDLPLIDKHAVAGHIMDQVVTLLAAAS